MQEVNVTVEVYSDWNTVDSIFSALSNGSGYYNISNITDNSAYMYKLIPRHYNSTSVNDTRVDFVGASLPAFPHSHFTTMLNLSAVNFYLKEAATIYISAINDSSEPRKFNYQLKDTLLGYPIQENWDWNNQVYNVTFYVPADRNYSIQMFPSESMPVYYNVNNLSDYSAPKFVNISFNTTMSPKWVSGFLNVGGQTNYDNITVLAYLLEPGNMVFAGQALPYDLSPWRGAGNNDIYNSSNGFYNMTLPATAMSSEMLLFATGNNGSVYYGSFKNLSIPLTSADLDNINFSMQVMLGSAANISVQDMGDSGALKNITAGQTTFALINGSGDAITTAQVHLEVELDYSDLITGLRSFTWMADISSGGTGTVTLPLFNYSVKKLNLFTQNFAPLNKKYTAAELDVTQVNLTLAQFNPGGIDAASGTINDLYIDILQSSTTCDVPSPPSGCSLAGESTEGNFKPLNAVVSGGAISFRMRKNSNNITVHYINVDMLASGPPDASFDGSANESASGSSLDQAWRFGSQGPEIYEKVLIGIPYDDSTVDESASMSILLNQLYDNDWNSIWTLAQNGTPSSGDLHSDYSTFNLTWFNATIDGMPCSTSDLQANCYVNTSTNMFWIRIPHFSGVGPTVKTVVRGAVEMNASTDVYNCTLNCSVHINVTNLNNTLYSSLQDININNTDTTANTRYFRIYKYNNSDWLLNGTNSSTHPNYNLTLSNGSSETIHQYRIDINKTNVTLTQWNFSYSIGDIVLSLILNLSCEEVWTCDSWSTCSGTQTRVCVENNECETENDRPSESQSCTSSSSGGGGGGGGGGTSTNVATKVAHYYTTIAADSSQTINIAKSNIGFTEIKIDVSNKVNSVTIETMALKAKPSGKDKPSEKVYQYLQVNPKKISDLDIKRAVIKFRVEKNWFAENAVSEDDVVLMRYTDKWDELSTTKLSSDSSYAHYQATSPGFSYFAVAVKAAETPEETSVEEPTTGEVPPTEGVPAEPPTEETPEAEAVAEEAKVKVDSKKLALIAVIVVLVALIVLAYSKLRKHTS